jgi:hypothetical protein
VTIEANDAASPHFQSVRVTEYAPMPLAFSTEKLYTAPAGKPDNDNVYTAPGGNVDNNTYTAPSAASVAYSPPPVQEYDASPTMEFNTYHAPPLVSDASVDTVYTAPPPPAIEYSAI